MKKILGTAVAVAAMFMSSGAQATPVTIDLFNGTQTATDSSADGAAVSSSALGADIIGGERDLSSNLVVKQANGIAESVVGFGKYSFSVGSGAKGIGTIQWDGVDNSPALSFGLGNLDLTDMFSNTAIEMIINEADHPFNFWVEAYTDATSWSRLMFVANVVTPYQDPGEPHYISFAGFTNAACGVSNPAIGLVGIQCGATAVDITRVNAIQVIIDPLAQTGAFDITIDQVRAIPEPGSLALAGLGLLGLAGLRRRKQA